jgi:hypothetical protein
MQPSTLACLSALLLGACSSAQYVTGDSRDMFDTAKGMYGGNEFGPRSTEGKITVANDANAGGASTAAPASAAPAPAPAVVAAAAPAAPAATAETTLAIDANAYAAVFGAAPAPLKPSAEQLLRLDSLALVATEGARVDLQTKVLACRRAGESCRITHR